jgi:IS5 family transposase
MEDNRPTLAQYFVEQVCPDNKFLEEMNNVIPWWEIENWFNKEVVKKNSKVGRPAYPIIMMFKIHLLQQWYNLSDREAEFQISDRLSFRKFLGLSIEDRVPDSTTIENFRHFLESRNAHKVLAQVLDNYFCKIGLIKKEGNLVDATFLRSKGKPHSDEEKNFDIDAQFGHKGYGYSATVNMDKDSKLIRKTVVTSAEILDFQSTDDVLIGDEKKVYADRGYDPARKLLEIKHPNTEFIIMHKRKRGKKGEPTPNLNVFKQEANKICARIRARVEHAFGIMKFVFGFQRLRYVGLERVTAKFNSLVIAYNFARLGFLLRNQGIAV